MFRPTHIYTNFDGVSLPVRHDGGCAVGQSLVTRPDGTTMVVKDLYLEHFDAKYWPSHLCIMTGKTHIPDWSTVHVEYDDDEYYLDVNCKHCGWSGCLGRSSILEEEIVW